MEIQNKSFGWFKSFGGWIFTFLYFLIDIFNNIISFLKTGDIKPVLDATLGRIFSADFRIARNVELLQSGNLESITRSILITEIVIMVVVMFVIIFFVSKFLNEKNHIPLVFSIPIAIMVAFVLDVIFFFIVNGFNTPFKIGLYELIKYGVSLI